MSGQRIFLFRSFFPSWRFFDDLADVPRLQVRWTEEGSTEFCSWTTLAKKPPFRLKQLFFNPEGNFFLTHQSLLSQLLMELSDLQSGAGCDLHSAHEQLKIQELVSYQLLQAEVKRMIQRQRSVQPTEYQFKIQIRLFDGSPSGSSDLQWEDILCSSSELIS